MHKRKKTYITILLACIMFLAYFAGNQGSFAFADGLDEQAIEFFQEGGTETIFNKEVGCPYRIFMPLETTGFRLYLDDLRLPANIEILVATTFSQDLDAQEEYAKEEWAQEVMPTVQVELQQTSSRKYVEANFMRNGIYRAKIYFDNEQEQPSLQRERYFHDIDFYAPFIGKAYEDGWQVYDDFYFEGQAMVLEYTVDDTKGKISASSGIKQINIYYSQEYNEDITMEDLVLKESKQFDKFQIKQKYSDSYKTEQSGFYYFETVDWVGNSRIYPPFAYQEMSDLNVFLRNIQSMLKWEGYTLYLKSSLQDSYDYYRFLLTSPTASKEEREAARLLLIEEKNSYENAKVATIVNMSGDITEGVSVYLSDKSYAPALKGDTLSLDLTINYLPKSYSDTGVLSRVEADSFDSALLVTAKLFYNGLKVAPSEPIAIYLPVGKGDTCIGVIEYTILDDMPSGYAATLFQEGDGWITFDYFGSDKSYVVLLANDNVKSLEWLWWVAIGVGMAGIIALAIVLTIKYKKEKEQSRPHTELSATEESVKENSENQT